MNPKNEPRRTGDGVSACEVEAPSREQSAPIEAATALEAEKLHLEDTQRAVLNILEDFNIERVQVEGTQKATLNILEDFNVEKLRLEDTQRAVLNILEDFNVERVQVEGTQRATLNILEDFNAEKLRLEDTQRAVLNILEDFSLEKGQLEGTQKATLNIMEDFNAEKLRLEDAQRAVLNILDDFDIEKTKVEQTNRLLQVKSEELNRSNDELQEARAILEVRVAERTAELRLSNAQLRAEMEERRRAEEQVKASLKEKEALLKEIHHRVKNNLQVIQSMLNLQLPQIKDEQSVELFKESQRRVYTMALIHEKLYQSESMAAIDMPEYVQSLISNLFLSFGVTGGAIKQRTKVDDISLDIDTAIPCALIINELVSNSLKHAFPGRRREDGSGVVRVDLLRAAGNAFMLTVSDNGVGLPQGFEALGRDTLGLKLVGVLVRQIRGTMQVSSEGGTTFTITFRRRNEEGA